MKPESEKKTILIIDDEPDVGLYLTKILEEHDFYIMTASSVNLALRVLDKTRPDLVCLDIMMPKESGISLYKQMKADHDLAMIPVIIISGVSRAGEFDIRSYVPDESIPAPEGYLEKPIKIFEFLNLVNRVIYSGDE